MRRIKSSCHWPLSSNAGYSLPGIKFQEPGCRDRNLTLHIRQVLVLVHKSFFFLLFHSLCVFVFLTLANVSPVGDRFEPIADVPIILVRMA